MSEAPGDAGSRNRRLVDYWREKYISCHHKLTRYRKYLRCTNQHYPAAEGSLGFTCTKCGYKSEEFVDKNDT
jgi:hypothetical protein